MSSSPHNSEKTSGSPVDAVDLERDIGLRTNDVHFMHRSLKGRQVSMIAIAGTIGTGLFLASGKALANGGPVGALLGYVIVGVLVGLMMVYDGLAILVSNGYGCAGRTSAAAIVISFWDADANHRAIYITVMLVGIILVNLCGVKYFGEFEFAFASLKIITIVGLIILCLVVDLGRAPDHDRRGFRYWREEPFNDNFFGIVPPSKARFLGFWAVLTQAAFSYAGMEALALICLEASKPRVTLRTAIRAVFYRIVLLYILSILLIGMCLSPTNPDLLQANEESSGDATESPFVIIITEARIKVLPHIINAVVLTSAFSASNELFYASTRSLFMLAQEGKAPRILAKVTKNGVPIYSIALCAVFGLLSHLACGKQGAMVAFNWLSSITTLSSMMIWCGIALAHIRWYRAMQVQGLSRDELPFRSWAQPYASWIVLISFPVIIFFSGFTTFLAKPFDSQSFVANYINIPFALILYVRYKMFKRTKIVSLAEMDCSSHYVEDSVVYSKYEES
uniref:Amino acid permease/ SLC12A domain-containing protein n=1 Tax=Mycena chlorophos TaxID=658473 RepID=A0ABQ0L6T8_MYCCL|nr:predicted protein [Mycena chlorophos]